VNINLTLDEQLDDEGGFIRFFKSLPDIGDDAVRIFDRGDWYTSHGNDAMFIAKTVRCRCLELLFC
jgi:DNA mismatch repair protein MSH2